MAARQRPRAVIFGCSGLELTPDETAFFRESDPLGFILFARNCNNPRQVKDLVSALRETVSDGAAPVLIDQEGGRVARLGPPHWRKPPAAALFGALADIDPAKADYAARLNAQLIAAELMDLGINVDCLPVLDIPQSDADPIIGDRAYSQEPGRVARLGRATCEGLMAGGVLPIIKHIPGHGRARQDSHEALPVVDSPRRELEELDFAPFRALSDMPWAMTAHIVYTDIDADAPATLSPTIVQDVIRDYMGFDGVLLTDDLSMKALTGNFGDRASAALAAGCDVVLHCNGEMDEMTAIAAATSPISDKTAERLSRTIPISAKEIDREAARRQVNELLAMVAA